jgi:hypothetical protein
MFLTTRNEKLPEKDTTVVSSFEKYTTVGSPTLGVTYVTEKRGCCGSQKFSHLYKKFWKKVELQCRKFSTKCFQFFYKCFPCPFLLFCAVKKVMLARTLLRQVVHARLSLYIIYLSRDVRSLVILYSFSQPHRSLYSLYPVHLTCYTRRILLPLLIVSCSPYSSYPVRLTRRILFALLVVSCSPYSSYLPDCFVSSYFGEHEVGWCLRFHQFFGSIVCCLWTEYRPSLILCVNWNTFLCDFLSFRLVHIRPQSFNLVCIVCQLLVCSLFAVVLLLSSSSRGSLTSVFALSFFRHHFRGRDIYCWFFFLVLVS